MTESDVTERLSTDVLEDDQGREPLLRRARGALTDRRTKATQLARTSTLEWHLEKDIFILGSPGNLRCICYSSLVILINVSF